MSPELKTPDELLCEDLPLAVVRSYFESGDRFARAMDAMLYAGEVRMLLDGEEVPKWRWREVLDAARDRSGPPNARLELTDAGADRIVG